MFSERATSQIVCSSRRFNDSNALSMGFGMQSREMQETQQQESCEILDSNVEEGNTVCTPALIRVLHEGIRGQKTHVVIFAWTKTKTTTTGFSICITLSEWFLQSIVACWKERRREYRFGVCSRNARAKFMHFCYDHLMLQ